MLNIHCEKVSHKLASKARYPYDLCRLQAGSKIHSYGFVDNWTSIAVCCKAFVLIWGAELKVIYPLM